LPFYISAYTTINELLAVFLYNKRDWQKKLKIEEKKLTKGNGAKLIH